MKKSSPVSRSGRFAGGPAADVARSPNPSPSTGGSGGTTSLGSMAHAAMLRKIGVLTAAEAAAPSSRGLDAIGREIEAGKFHWKPELEDVHMNIEAELTRRVPAGAKLHTGRSRNDQVALDMRLWLRDEIDALLGGDLRGLQRALVGLGEQQRRRHHPRLHPPAARPAGLSRPSPARLRRDARARLRAARRLPRSASTSARSAAARSPAPPCRSTASSSPSCSASWTPTAGRSSRRTRWTP